VFGSDRAANVTRVAEPRKAVFRNGLSDDIETAVVLLYVTVTHADIGRCLARTSQEESPPDAL